MLNSAAPLIGLSASNTTDNSFSPSAAIGRLFRLEYAMAGYQIEAGAAQQEAGFGYYNNQYSVSNLDGYTAKASGTQATAVTMDRMINRVTTVATAGDAVALPAARAGHQVCIINAGANSLQVYGQNGSSDTINGIAGSTGVSQMAGSTVFFICPGNGVWLSSGLGTGQSGSLETSSYANALVAAGNNTATGATLITASITEFATVATTTNSAILPAATPGLTLTIINNGANTLNVFPAGTDKINTGSAGAATTVAAAAVTIFFTTAAGQWYTK
jgi:hypothetical protein